MSSLLVLKPFLEVFIVAFSLLVLKPFLEVFIVAFIIPYVSLLANMIGAKPNGLTAPFLVSFE